MAVFVSMWDGGSIEFDSECEVARAEDGTMRVTSMSPAVAVDEDGYVVSDPDEVDALLQEASHLDEEYVEAAGVLHTALRAGDWDPALARELDRRGNGVVLYD